jgi:type IV pilus assembly protein PilQ
MSKRITGVMSAAFFCSLGWVYNAPAIGADEATPVDPAAAKADLPKGQSVKVSSFGQIDLHVKDLELSKVLQLLSIQSRRNIIASKSVAGAVSADLYGVDFYEALDAILHANGMGYVEKGNFVYVYTAQEIKTIADAERKMASRMVRLNYISAADAAAFVQPMLSQGGSIAVNSAATPGFSPTISDGGANTFAHPDTLIIRDFPEVTDEIFRIVKDLDIRPKQVMVEATVLQADLKEKNEFGVDVSILIDTDLTKFASPLNVVDSVLGGNVVGGSPTSSTYNNLGNNTTMQTGVGNTNAAGGTKVGILNKNVSAFVRALDEVTDTTVLAKPKLLVLNRQKADLLVGQKLGYLSTTATSTTSTQTVEFLEVGTKLALRPFISDDGFIRMELKPAISDGKTVPQGTGGTVIPEENTQEVTTNVLVRSGQTIILGGLFKENTTVTRRQTPFLGDIPFLGAAFKGQEDDHKRSEVIFLITPTVLKDQSLYAAGEKVKDSIESARLGARQELLPWSRTKLTASHVRNAQEAAGKGERDKAIWSVNMALSLDPTFVEAIKLREELTGQKTYWPSNSILDSSLDKIIEKQIDADTTPKAAAPASAPVATNATPAAAPAAVPASEAPATPATVTPTAAPAPAASAAPATPTAEVTTRVSLPPVTTPAPAATETPAAAANTEASASSATATPAKPQLVPDIVDNDHVNAENNEYATVPTDN